MIEEALYLLKVYRSEVPSRVFRLALETSPFYPSALSLERTFSFFGLNVMVGKAGANDLDRIPPYFLAFVDVNGSAETILIHRKVSGALELYHSADRSFKDLPYDELKRVWRGYVLYITDVALLIHSPDRSETTQDDCTHSCISLSPYSLCY